MKKIIFELGDYILWYGELARIIGKSDRPMVIIEYVHKRVCPHCKQILGAEQVHSVIDSPQFHEAIETVKTIKISN